MAHSVSNVDKAMDAARRGSWGEAYDLFCGLDPSSLLVESLEAFADSAWWLSRLDESIALRQKAYAGYATAGDHRRAGYAAWFLLYDYLGKGELSIATGWLRRAHRHLDAEPECLEQGYLALADADLANRAGELDRAEHSAEQGIEIGKRLGSPNLVSLGIQNLGRVYIAQDRVAEGAELLDEAMTSVLAGELSPFIAGWIYCNVIGACLELADLRRAGEWTEAARAWCESLPSGTPYHGLCRLYRLEVVSLRGAWAEAEAEAGLARDEIMSFSPYLAGQALYEVGEIRRRRGDLAGAEEAFTQALELGREPQPGLALVRLAQGKAETATAALRLALAAESGNDRMGRARLLAAQVEAEVAAGELQAAAAAMDELQAIASDSKSPWLVATAAMARGSVRLSEGDLPRAMSSLRRASTLWQELRLPYEAARTRVLIAEACRRGGDEERARLELQAARKEFEGLGAAADAAGAARQMEVPGALPAGLSRREAEVLRLVAAGKTNRQIAAELFISEHTVARHLSTIFTKLGLSTRSAATAFAFEHGLV